MKTCSACRTSNADDAGYCLSCGAALGVQATPARAGGSTVPAEPISNVLQEDKPRPVQPPAAQPAGLLAAGHVVDGKYNIEKLLGEGGMGVVYLARDIHTQVEVVIKAIRTEYAHRQEFRERILEEGRALARIDHPNVVRLNAVVVEPEALYLVMQFIEGEALDHRIERYVQARTPMSLEEALRLFRMVLQGVAAAHHEGVIHRDLKPANILYRTRDGVAKVTDFGIAKAEEDAKAGRGQTRGIIGSLLYMAPEQISGRRDLDKRVDIYALGILLFELLVGRVPFDAPSEFEIMKLHMEGPVPRISQMRSDVPPSIDDVIQKACAKNREARFQSCEEFLEALRGVDAQAAADVHTAPPPVARPATGVLPVVPPPIALADTAEAEAPLAETDSPKGRGFLLGLVIGIVLFVGLGAGGVAVAYSLGWIGGPSPSRRQRPHSSSSATTTTSVRVVHSVPSALPEAAPPSSPLKPLVGAWKSDTGKLYDAVLVADTLEFRIHDLGDYAKQGYYEAEARFSLTAIPGESRSFNVEDKIRPSPPEGYTYDPRARGTCQEVWSSIEKKPLRAQFDGTRLTVDLVKIEPALTSNFELEGTKVVACKGLKKVTTSKIESSLTRP